MGGIRVHESRTATHAGTLTHILCLSYIQVDVGGVEIAVSAEVIGELTFVTGGQAGLADKFCGVLEILGGTAGEALAIVEVDSGGYLGAVASCAGRQGYIGVTLHTREIAQCAKLHHIRRCRNLIPSRCITRNSGKISGYGTRSIQCRNSNSKLTPIILQVLSWELCSSGGEGGPGGGRGGGSVIANVKL